MAKTKNNLVVLGAGWLGSALCKQAQNNAWQVQGTRTSDQLTHSYERQFVVKNGQLIHQVDLLNAYWVCAIPPRCKNSESNYAHTLSVGINLAKKLNAKGFLLCSSTGVYDQEPGLYTESSDIACNNERQIKLYQAEQQVLENNGKVLRLAGLLGPNREPGRFVAAKQLNTSSQQVVNMVHQQDVINAIFAVLNNWQQSQNIYNVVNPSHPTKAQYYAQKCQSYGTRMPCFANDEVAKRTIVGSAIEALGFNYQFTI